MKNIFLLSIVLSLCLNANLSVSQIENMVQQIHEKREGIDLKTLENTKEPFVRLEESNSTSIFVIPEKESAEVKLNLHAIVNGKAFINDGWMGVGENILGYQLKFVGKRGVVLRNENHIKKLFLRKKRDSFIQIKER